MSRTFNNTRSSGPIHVAKLEIDSIEPYSVTHVLNMVRDLARKRGMSICGRTSCRATITFEWNERDGDDFQKLADDLKHNFVAFTAEVDPDEKVC